MKTSITVFVENTVNVGKFMGEHGFSVYIETPDGILLWDTGQSNLFDFNARILGKDLTEITAVALSHGHYDHTSGLEHLLSVTGPLPVYGHEGIFQDRWHVRTNNGTLSSRHIGFPYTRSDMESKGADFILSDKPILPISGMTLTGEIPRNCNYENPGGAFFLDESGTIPDIIRDDQSLIIDTQSGPVVLLGCCHAGIINTLTYISDMLDTKRFALVAGGMHLLNANDNRMTETVKALSNFRIDTLAPGHCTGWQAVCLFNQTSSSRVTPLETGWSMSF